MESWTEIVGLIMGGIVTAAISVGVAAFSKMTGINVEANHRAAMHSGFLSAASWAVNKWGPEGAKQNLLAIIEQAKNGNRDAWAALNPTREVELKLAAAKLEQVTNPNVSPTIS